MFRSQSAEKFPGTLTGIAAVPHGSTLRAITGGGAKIIYDGKPEPAKQRAPINDS